MRSNTYLKIIACLTLISSAATLESARADDRVWLGLSSGFHNPLAWVDGVIPIESDTAIFPGNAGVDFDETDAVVDRVILRNGESDFGLANASLTLLNPSLAAPSFVAGEAFGDQCDFQLWDGVIHAQNAAIGWDAGSSGRVQIGQWYDVSGTLLVDGHLGVGYMGEGTLDIRIGTVESAFASIGLHETAVGEVNMGGPGVAWTNDLTLNIGKFGRGALNMNLSAQVDTGSVIVAHHDAAEGSIVVEGNFTALNINGDLDLGLFGEATMHVADRATVTVSSVCSLGMFATYEVVGGAVVLVDFADGALTVTGKETSFTCGGEMYVGSFGSGSVTVLDGASLTAPLIVLKTSPVQPDARSTLGGDSLISANVTGDGVITPGAPVGKLAIDGDVDSVDAEFEIAGTDQGAFDRLVVNGELDPDGAVIHLRLADGFMPTPGDSWEVIAAVDVVSTYGSIDGDPLPNGLTWQVTYPENHVVVTVANEVFADLNSDGVVNSADLAIVLGNWGQCPSPIEPCPPDLDEDGEVGPADLAIVLGNWT